jgi:hypothetical protein
MRFRLNKLHQNSLLVIYIKRNLAIKNPTLLNQALIYISIQNPEELSK